MSVIPLKADIREGRGKGNARRCRSAGFLPGVLYGQKKTPVSLNINYHDFDRILRSHVSRNLVFDIDIEGIAEKETRYVMIKDMQFHHITDAIMHVDFLEVRADQEVDVSIALQFEGVPVGIADQGGILEILNRELKCRTLALEIPETLIADISALEIEKVFFLKDMAYPKGVAILEDMECALARITNPVKAALAAEAAEAAEAEEAAEGEAAETESETEETEASQS